MEFKLVTNKKPQEMVEEEVSIQKDIWALTGNRYYLTQPSIELDKLENAVYSIHVDPMGQFFIKKKQFQFDFDYKIYGLEQKLISRILHTYESTNGNLGVLLNGLKGTGKTVTAKIISNYLEQPVLVVDAHLDGIHKFINSIPQNITVFIDEYEKIFGNSSEMLTIMDGALNSEYRRVFLLTTNELRVDENLIQRPSRIRYLKKFEDLTSQIVEEIVDDILIYKEFKKECIRFISNLEVITVDIVKAVLNEVNIHKEEPNNFSDVFNVRKNKGKFNIQVRSKNGKFIDFINDVWINQKPTYKDGHIGNWLEVGDVYLGKISKIINWNIIEVSPVKQKGKQNVLSEPTIFKITDADIQHYNYLYGMDGMDDDYDNITSKKMVQEKPTELSIQSEEINNMITLFNKANQDDELEMPKDEVSSF